MAYRYQRLEDLRKENGFSEAEIAKKLNMKQSGYSKYEVGARGIPTEVLVELSRLYDRSVDYILGLTDEEEPYPRNDSREYYYEPYRKKKGVRYDEEVIEREYRDARAVMKEKRKARTEGRSAGKGEVVKEIVD